MKFIFKFFFIFSLYILEFITHSIKKVINLKFNGWIYIYQCGPRISAYAFPIR